MRVDDIRAKLQSDPPNSFRDTSRIFAGSRQIDKPGRSGKSLAHWLAERDHERRNIMRRQCRSQIEGHTFGSADLNARHDLKHPQSFRKMRVKLG
jgi:hypothetical protein